MINFNENLLNRARKIKKEKSIASLISSLEKDSSKDPTALALLNKLSFKVMDMGETLLDDSHRKFLSEIMLEEKPTLQSNNLILAPAGSGKTTLINEVLIEPENKDKFLLLSSFKTDNDDFSITYQEFGETIKRNPEFINGFNYILCDDFHLFFKDKSSEDLDVAKILLSQYDDKQIFYFSINKENIVNLRKVCPNLISNIIVYDYTNHEEIKKYVEIDEMRIKDISELNIFFNKIENALIHKPNYKGLLLGDTLKELRKLELTLLNCGIKPLVLWLDKNTNEKLSEKQSQSLKYLLETKKIPNEYNFLIMSSDLKQKIEIEDLRLKYAIINKEHERDGILGKLRHRINLVVYSSANVSIESESKKEKNIDKYSFSELEDASFFDIIKY